MYSMGFEPIFLQRKCNVLTIRRRVFFLIQITRKKGFEPLSLVLKTNILTIKLLST